jgi:hypothetical protein
LILLLEFRYSIEGSEVVVVFANVTRQVVCSCYVCIKWSLAAPVHELTHKVAVGEKGNYLRIPPPKTKKRKAYTCLVDGRHRRHHPA